MISSAQPLANATTSSTGIRHQVSYEFGGHDRRADAQRPRRDVEPEAGQADQRREAEAAEHVGPPAEVGPARCRAGPKPLRHNRYSAEHPPRDELEHDGQVQRRGRSGRSASAAG